MLGPAASRVNIRAMNLEIAFWQWSNAVQITSVLMIAVFLAVLRRSVPERRRRPGIGTDNIGE